MKADAERIALDLQKAKANEEIEKERIASQERIAGAKIGYDAASDNANEYALASPIFAPSLSLSNVVLLLYNSTSVESSFMLGAGTPEA